MPLYEFLKAVNFAPRGGRIVRFEAGIHDLPNDVGGHWWLRVNGVRPT